MEFIACLLCLIAGFFIKDPVTGWLSDLEDKKELEEYFRDN